VLARTYIDITGRKLLQIRLGHVIFLTACIYLVLNAASKRISTNFHLQPNHKRCPHLRFISLNSYMARHQLHN